MDRFETHTKAALLHRPFYDEEPMVGPPDCSEAAFKQPLLRRCPFDLDAISWIARLGGGLDGFVWKIMVGDQGPYVMKVFWDTKPPNRYVLYYAAQREAQNAALLEKIEAAVSDATKALPIRVRAEPSTYEDAVNNLLAFSTEGRQRQQVKDTDAVEISSIPHMKKCLGWLKIDGDYLRNLPWELRPLTVSLQKFGDRQILPNRQHFAMVYEYIPEGENDAGNMQPVLDFFWRAGFDFSQLLRHENWKSGVLVDFSDFISPMGDCWNPKRYNRVVVPRTFSPRPPPPG